MGIVSENGDEFYQTLFIEKHYDLWVKENVVPVLGPDPRIHLPQLQNRLRDYFLKTSDGSIMLYADWPDDIRYLMETLITGPGTMIDITDMFMCYNRRLSAAGSKIPHNALEDAHAIRRSFHALLN